MAIRNPTGRAGGIFSRPPGAARLFTARALKPGGAEKKKNVNFC